MNDFLRMGGYAAFVWPSYFITLAIVALNIIWARRALARASIEAQRRLSAKGVPT